MSRKIEFPVRPIMFASFLLVFAALLAGCDTVEGAGKDIKAGGQAIQHSAE